MLGKENGNNGGFFSWNDPDQQTVRELEKENKLLKEIYQKELEGKLKTIVKKSSLGEKKRL
jgi:hypothetical protein